MRPITRSSPLHRTFARYAPWLIVGGLLLAVGLVYGQIVYFKFLEYDDNHFVTRCAPVKAGLTAKSIAWAFTNGPAGDWYPLAMLSHMLDCQIWGLNPLGHFLSNLVLHAATVVTLFLVLWRMTSQPAGRSAETQRAVPEVARALPAIGARSGTSERREGRVSGPERDNTVRVAAAGPSAKTQRAVPEVARASGGRVAPAGPSAKTTTLWPSALVAGLLAVHPQHVESVAWIAERRDVLSGFLMMLTLAAYLGYVRARQVGEQPRGARVAGWYVLTAILFALGLMAKPMLVTLPLVLLLLDYWPLGRFGSAEDSADRLEGPRRERFTWLLIEKLPLVALSVGDAVVTLTRHLAGPAPVPLTERLAFAPVAVVTYLVHFLDPLELSPLYMYPVGGVAPWKVAGSLAVLIAISLALIVGRRKYPYGFVGWFWFLGMLVPVLGVLTFANHAMADRYMYLPGIGVYLAVSFGGWHWASKTAPRMCLFAGTAAVVLFVLSVLATQQAAYWRDGETLWHHAIAVTGTNPEIERTLGEITRKQGRFDLAEEHFRNGVDGMIDPDVINNYGMVLMARNKLEEAAGVFRRGLEIAPKHSRMMSNLGAALLELNKPEEAELPLRKAIELDPRFIQPRVNLAKALAMEGDYDQARQVCREALKLDPSDRIARNLMATLSKYGKSKPKPGDATKANEAPKPSGTGATEPDATGSPNSQ